MASSVVCTVAVQRIEVITGAGGRRAYSAEEKIRLVGEARGGRGAVAAVARRHGACSSLIYRWRRQMRSGELSLEAAPLCRCMWLKRRPLPAWCHPPRCSPCHRGLPLSVRPRWSRWCSPTAVCCVSVSVIRRGKVALTQFW
ncbi:transposase [Nitrospirillum amazonense]|uniref:transposase n=1 Tax=Nitrospirillum amazonense TaxID=28077 RepID=UPI0011A49514